MAFCTKCGRQLEEGATVCPNCGEPVKSAGASTAGDKVRDEFNKITEMRDTTSSYDPQDIANNKAMAVLAYIGFLVLVPLLGAKESKYARFHTNQGLVLFIFEVAVGLISAILGWIPVLGWIIKIVCGLIDVVALVFAILGIVNACKGVCKELPIIGGIKLLK